MELRHLRYFTATAEELNFSKASRRLNVSQPAISRMIRDLEEELGKPLFVRKRIGLDLTEAGEKLLVFARRILDTSNEAIRVVGSLPDSAHMLNIGFIPSINTILGEGLKSFRNAHPEVSVKIHELSPAEQVRLLRNRQLDVALIGNHPCDGLHRDIETTYLFDVRLEAVIPATHRLSGRNRVSLKELEHDEFIGYNEESFPGRNTTIINACKVADFSPDLHYQANSLVEVLALISAGAGVCLMPADVVSLPHTGVLFVPIRENLGPIRFTAAWRKENNETVRDLIEILRSFKT